MKFVGLRLDGHGANVTYTDGTKVRYCEIARDLQIKHFGYDDDLIQWTYLLKRWNVTPGEIDAIGISIDGFLHGGLQFDLNKIYEIINIPSFEQMGFTCPIFRIDHHLGHSLSIWPLKEKCDIGLIFDGFGDDFITHSIYQGYSREEYYYRHELSSLGIIMCEVAELMKISGLMDDLPGKLMALKSHSITPKEKRKAIISCLDKLSIQDLDYVWGHPYFQKLDFESQADLVSIAHEVSENIFSKYFAEISEKYGAKKVSYTGGIALNTVINSKIRERVPGLVVPPHTNDTGMSLGLVEFLRQYYDQDEFDTSGFPFWQDDECPSESPTEDTIQETAEMLANGMIVGWYQGHGEIGPRALGNRSILMDPSHPNGKVIINDKVKHREWYRPFGASVLETEVSNYFDWEGKSEYMLYVMNVLDPQRFPSITHIDGTCRAQTVNETNKNFFELINKFKEITGIPMLLNTSLNKGGKPIAGHICNALDVFNDTDLDALVVGNTIYRK